MRIVLHLSFIVLNQIFGFAPCTQYVTKDWQVLASAAKHPEINTTLIIL